MNFKEFSFQGNWNADFQLTHQMKKNENTALESDAFETSILW